MTSDELLIDRSVDGVVTVTFNRPAKMNAFTASMYAGLHELCDELAGNTEVRVLVLRGAGGRAFAAGNEISDFLSRDGAEYEAWISSLFGKVAALPQVTVAVIDGVCVGGGLAMSIHCDVRIATIQSRFGLPIGKTLGNALPAPLVYRVASVFGEPIAREMLLTARLVGADRAYHLGAIAACVEDLGALEIELDKIISNVTAMSRVTIGHTKLQLTHLNAATDVAAPEEELRLREIYSGPDFAEGVRAFLAKEKPAFPSVVGNEKPSVV